MQRHAKPTFGAAAVLTVAFAAGGARAAGREEIKEPLPSLPRNVREECWLSAPAGEPKIPCELALGGSSRGGDRAVLVRERGGARRRGVAVQVRGASVELFGAGHAAGSVGADLGWMKTWTVLHNRDPRDSLDSDALLLAPAASPGAHKLPASVLLAPTNEDAEMRLLESPDGIHAAIGLADPRRRFVALDLLEGEYDVQPIKTLLLPGLDDPDELVRLAVAEVLGASKVSEAAETVASWLGPGRTDVSPFTRRQIVHALGTIGSPMAEPALEGALADEAFGVRQAAVWALGELGLPAAAPLVAARFEDVDPRVRREAAATLGLFKDSGANDSPVVRGYRKAFADPDQRTRLAAVRAATPLELRALVPAFIERLADPDGEVQYAAVQAVAKLGAREAAPHLVPLLKSGGARVKHPEALCFIPATSYPLACEAARTLQKLGDAAGIAEARRLVPHCLAAPDAGRAAPR